MSLTLAGMPLVVYVCAGKEKRRKKCMDHEGHEY
jgi:hypothetical protein